MKVLTSADILVVVFARNGRRYVKNFRSMDAAGKYPGRCLRKENRRALLEGYRVLPVFNFSQGDGVYTYSLNYKKIEPIKVLTTPAHPTPVPATM